MENAPKYSDAARRCSNEIRLHIAGKAAGRWAAIRLSDGGSDGIAYDTKSDAMRHQLHATQCAYVLIPADDMPPADAEAYLSMVRRMYDSGFRDTNPDQYVGISTNPNL